MWTGGGGGGTDRNHGDSNLYYAYVVQEREGHHEDTQAQHKDSNHPKRYVPSMKATDTSAWKPNL